MNKSGYHAGFPDQGLPTTRMKFPSPPVADFALPSRAAVRDGAYLQSPRAIVPSGQVSTVHDYVRVCIEHWRVLTLIVVGGGLLAVLVTRLQTPVFRAETLVEVRTISPDFLNMREASPFVHPQYGADLTIDMETHVEVFQSADVLRNTIDTMAASAASHPDWLPRRAAWSIPGWRPAPVPARDLLSDVADTLYVERAGATKLIRLQVDAPSPGLAADFANSLVRRYMQANIDARTQIESDAEFITHHQLDAMRSRITDEEERLQKYAAASQLFRDGGRGSLSDDRLKQLQSALLQARADLAAKDAAQRLARSQNAGALPAVVNDANLRALQSQLIDLRTKEAELTTVYQPEHDQIRQIRAAASQLEYQIQQETAKVVAVIDGEDRLAKEKEKSLAAAYDAATLDAEKTSQAAAQYDLLEKDIQTDLLAYQRVLSQAKSLNLASALQAADLLVPQPAVPPDRPRLPNLARNMIMGLFASLVIGIACIASRQHFDRSVQVPGDLRIFSGAAELGAISSILPGSGVMRHFRNIPGRVLPAAAIDRKRAQAVEPVADDFRGVAASLLWSSPAVGARGYWPKEPLIGGARVIVITSAAPGEGKTTVTANLGSALARAGRSLLLIDGDVRRPALHMHFGLTNRRGLTDVLKEQVDDDGVLAAIQQTDIPGLSLLSSGSDEERPIDLLFQPGLSTLIARLRGRFDFILVDSPPMVQCPDTRSLANAADGVILIARSRRTAQESFRSVCERLRLDGVRLLGVVLNDFKAGNAPYKYYARV